MRRHHRSRSAALALLTALATAGVLPTASASAAGSPTPQSTTPHLDAVERTLRQVSPGLEGSVWQRTDGNRMDAPAGDPAGWLLQTPGCWGDPACADRPGTRALLDRTTEVIASATRTVDISTLAPFPDGAFEDAIVAGLKSSVASGHRLKVRILVGAAPLYNIGSVPAKYRDELVGRLGDTAGAVDLQVASVTTAKTAFSWNHSKLLVVDGSRVVTGGINGWSKDYLATAHPVTDADLALAGPAAASAGAYLDTLWGWTCDHTGLFSAAWFASSNGAPCTPDLERRTDAGPVDPAGSVPVIAVGGLGVGVKAADPASGYRPMPTPTPAGLTCGPLPLPDHTNADRDYETVNPEENALRALLASAGAHIEISQQDLNGTCPPLPRYDLRLYDILAGKLADGVKVRIVVSDPANRGAVGSGGYSQITSLAEISDLLKARLTARLGDQDKARAAMCGNLQLASFRAATTPTWADGHPYALHHKLVAVDGAAFYLGSKNLYPAWLQDFGYLVEDRTAAAQLTDSLLDPEWRNSQGTATVDWSRGLCQA